jgi:hypothetical protein
VLGRLSSSVEGLLPSRVVLADVTAIERAVKRLSGPLLVLVGRLRVAYTRAWLLLTHWFHHISLWLNCINTKRFRLCKTKSRNSLWPSLAKTNKDPCKERSKTERRSIWYTPIYGVVQELVVKYCLGKSQR